MASAGHHVIPESELLKFRLYYFVIHYGTRVLFRIFSCCFMEGNLHTIREILEENGIPLGRRSQFNGQEIEKMDREPPESLDITALNKICQVLWRKGVKYPSDKMKDLVTKIKDERNIVNHDTKRNMSQSELGFKLQEFREILEEVLDEAASLYLCHRDEFNNLKSEIRDSIPKIMERIREKYDPSYPETCKRGQAEIEEFGDSPREYKRQRSVKGLKPLNELLCRILPFEHLCQYSVTDSCKIVVSLRMHTDKEFHAGHSSDEFVTLDQNKMLDQRDLKGNDPEVVIISGDVGAGKTCLLSSIKDKWPKNETGDFPNLSSYQILMYMEFKKENYKSFWESLEDLLQNAVADFDVKRRRSSILNSKCLILCDGYNEKNDTSEKLFKEILGLKCRGLKIVVTTRPVNTKQLTETVNNSNRHRINLSILGLQGEQMKRLIRNLTIYLVKNKTQRDMMEREMLEAVDCMVPQVKDILKNPLQLSVFVRLYVECPPLRGSINSVSKLFIELRKESFKRLMNKLDMESDQKLLDLQSIVNACSLKYAYERKYELREGDIKSIKDTCDKLQLSFPDVISSYFNIEHTTEDSHVEKIYCYKYRSEQEFDAAGAICEVILKFPKEKNYDSIQLREEIKAVLPSVERDDFLLSLVPMENRIVTFVLGILYNTDKGLLYLVRDDILHAFHITKIDSVFGVFDQYDFDMDHLLSSLQEVNNDAKVVDSIVRSIKRNCGQKSPNLILTGTNDLLQVPSLLSRIQPARLIMRFSEDVNPDDRPDLINVFDFATKNDVNIGLDFSYTSENESVSYPDRYLELAKTCDQFRGRLKQDTSALPTCIRYLHLTLDIETLDCLSNCLPLLQQLEELNLTIVDRGTISASQLNHLRGSLHVDYHVDANLDVNSTTKRITAAINCILRDTRTDNLSISSRPELTRDAAMQVKESLEILIPHQLNIRCLRDSLWFFDGKEISFGKTTNMLVCPT